MKKLLGILVLGLMIGARNKTRKRLEINLSQQQEVL